MKIKEITEDTLYFDNGNYIDFDHCQECYEWNYADFKQLEDTPAMDVDFNENLKFEKVDGGFRFGDDFVGMFFVPCYSEQNGYYTYDIDIFYNSHLVVETECEGFGGF